MGIVSKEYIDSINKTSRGKTNANQCINTDAVVTRFQNIENKGIILLIKLDIVNFYTA